MDSNFVAVLAVDAAAAHIGNGAAMTTSAVVALDDARALLAAGDDAAAARRALASLAFSVGVFHADHRAIAAAL